MQYSFMSFSCPELSLEQMMEAARQFGYQGIEPRSASGHRHGVELETDKKKRRAIRTAVKAAGVPLACIATSLRYSDPATAAAQVEETRKYIDLAHDIGCPRLRVFGGAIPQGKGRDGAITLLAESLAAIADHAASAAVTICVETHDDWCNPEHLAAVMKRVAHPAIGINWDIMHPVLTGGVTMASAFNVLKPWIRHVHFHDGRKKAGQIEYVPIGTGGVDHRAPVGLLKAVAYKGFLSGEWIGWTPWETHLPAEIAAMRGYESAT